mgnify:CR=1 FL=1
MFSWIETKYINLLSPRLERFKKAGSGYNFRCPYCGDSRKSKTKARGWLFSKSDGTRFFCHNCSKSSKFRYFLKDTDQQLYYDFVKETLVEKDKEKSSLQEFVDKMKEPEYVKKTNLKALKKISQLAPNHKAKQYIMKRYIPPQTHHKIYYAPKFREWTNSMIPNKFEGDYEESRIIFPLLDENQKMFGFQGRSLRGDDALKYITIMLEERPKIYGLDSIDKNQKICAFEGPVDSLFIENSLASCGGSVQSNLEQLDIPRDNFVIVYDNEPRNRHTIKKMEYAIDAGYNVCIWPDGLKPKDVNDMVLSGITSPDIKKIISKNTHSGLSATLELNAWRKVCP